MKAKILFVERKYWKKDFLAFSIEKIYEQIAKILREKKYETSFIKVPFGNSFAEMLKNIFYFRAPKADLYHITGQVHYMAFVLPKRRTVLTIHDLEFLKIRTGLRRLAIKKVYLDLPISRLDYVTTVSEATKREILAISNFPEEKIRVIENPLQEQYLTSKSKGFNKECPTILQVGIAHNKNIPNLIKALQGISCCLRIIGNLPPELSAELDSSEIRYENVFGLTDSEMKSEYQNADIVAYCSTNEGFGLPIIEGQAMRTPVITSDISPMKEVSGGAAFLADPRDVSSIREGVLKIINDVEFREKIVGQGLENVKKYDPEFIAGLYEELYLEVLNNSN
jgi:glycosyltransferase involved in cell wall biosynthesis